ncbi:MAG: radical SAM protein [Desulfobacteraceae bacterium]|nr:radical SAM protein [Desulfobacteraceae bacterium]
MKKTVEFSKDAANVFFHILTACNLSCRHCYINPDQHGSSTLPISTIREWLAVFAKRHPKTNLIFLGGEPTLHPDLSEAVKIAKKLGFASITVDTNGYLFHDILSKLGPDELDYLSFSLDGASPETNDPLRGKGCFDICTANIRNAKAKGFHTSLIYTVSRLNIHDLDNMPDLLKKLGVDRFFIQVIGIRGKPANSETSLQLSRNEWITVIPKVAETVADLGIRVTYPKVFSEPDEQFLCAGRVADNYFIFPNGRVYRCPLCEDFPLNSLRLENNCLSENPKINEKDLFLLDISEGCVMNKLIQPENLSYKPDGRPEYKIACCMLKQEVIK